MKKLMILICSLLLGAVPAQADFELAKQYYDAGNFEKAFNEFMAMAKIGDHDAQNNVGIMYYRGEFVPKDRAQAYAWMTLATQYQGYKDDGLNIKIFNKFTDEEKQKATEKYNSLYAQLNDNAIETTLTPSFNGATSRVKEQRRIKAVVAEYPRTMLRNCGAAGDCSGFVDMTFTVDKHGYTRDQRIDFSTNKAFDKPALNALRQWIFEPLMVNGQPADVNGVKVRYKFAVSGTETDEKKLQKMVNAIRDKAVNGDAKDKLTYAYFLEIVPSYSKTLQISDNPNQWYLESSKAGNSYSNYFMGRNILYGNMCEANSSQSLAWLIKAAKLGVDDASYLMAIESFSGARLEKNEEKGFYWLAKAAKTNVFAKVRYAWILSTHPDQSKRNGKLAEQLLENIPENYVDLQSFYEAKAAAAAENNNFVEAIKWQEKAIADAKELGISISFGEAKLAQYKDNKSWLEAI